MLHKKKIVLYFKEETIDSKKLQSAVTSLHLGNEQYKQLPQKIKKSQERKREREREEERVRTGGKRRSKKRKRKKGRKKRKKMEIAVLKVPFEYTAPSGCIP